MPHPWLSTPLAEYEGHMGSPAVQQLAPLSDLFAEALALREPASVAILGIAGGNGLERIPPERTSRIVGVDINQVYLAAVRRRHANLPQLELHCADLATQRVDIPPVALVHAGLLFEHTGTQTALENALALVEPSGALSVVLQMPGLPGHDVGNSGYASMQAHRSHFQLIDRDAFISNLRTRGFTLAHQTRRNVPAGKTLWLGIFRGHRTLFPVDGT